jgi:hypothetical protein
VTFLQQLAKNGKRLKSCPEKQRIRRCASRNTFSRNSTDAWNSQLSQTPAFSTQIFAIPLWLYGHCQTACRSRAMPLLNQSAVAV